MGSRVLYALPEHLEIVDKGGLRVGAKVRLVEPHAYDVTLWSDESSRCMVKSICKQCKSVELEQTFTWWHTSFGQLDVPSDVGCPLDHEYKCKHIGHPGKCKYVCFNCKKWCD